MRHELRLADIGEGLDEAEIIGWRVRVGDTVTRDQPMVEIMTDKSNAELPAPWTGTVVELAGSVGDIINVGDLIAVIDDASPAQPPTGPGGTVPTVSAAHVGAPEAAIADEPPAARDDPRPKASPSTRRRALERGIDLMAVVGTGPGGRILLSDLDAAPRVHTTPAAVAHDRDAASTPAGSPATTEASSSADAAGERTEPLRGVRRAIARNMTTSWSEIPHIHAFRQIDAEPLLAFRDRLKSTGRPAFEQLTAFTVCVAAVASALRAHPETNASINMDRDTITYHDSINIGVAVAAPQGLVVPVLRAADTLDLEALSVAIREMVDAARQGVLTPEQMTGGTVTITNFGALGGEQATPLIRPPEALIIGFGSIEQRPFVIDGSVVARNTMHLVIGADHRLLDGEVTTSVLGHVADILLEPLTLFLGP